MLSVEFLKHKQTNVLVKLKRQHPPAPPPRANPMHLTLHHAWGGGNFNIALQQWRI